MNRVNQVKRFIKSPDSKTIIIRGLSYDEYRRLWNIRLELKARSWKQVVLMLAEKKEKKEW